MTQAFGTWLKDQQHRDDPIGDLAQDFLRDIKASGHVPPSRWTDANLKNHLVYRQASKAALAALDQAVKEWRRSR